MTKQKRENERIYPKKKLKKDGFSFVRGIPISEDLAEGTRTEVDRERYLKRISPIFEEMAAERIEKRERRLKKKRRLETEQINREAKSEATKKSIRPHSANHL